MSRYMPRLDPSQGPDSPRGEFYTCRHRHSGGPQRGAPAGLSPECLGYGDRDDTFHERSESILCAACAHVLDAGQTPAFFAGGSLDGELHRPVGEPLWFRDNDGLYYRHGWLDLPDLGRVALYGRGNWITGTQHYALFDYDAPYVNPKPPKNKSFMGAFRKGAQAAISGPEVNPYDDHRTYRGGVTFSRAYGREWDEGYAAGQVLKGALRGFR